KAVDALRRDLTGVRTGRASPALLDRVKVEVYDSVLPLSQLAAVTTPEPRLIVVQPWDRATLSAVEKAILKSDLGLMPLSDGHLLRLPIPPLTQERRQELVKVVRRRVEEARVNLRNLRRDAVEELRKEEREKLLSQDEQRRAAERLQKLTDSYIEEVKVVAGEKEAEILEG
ncbi:MAG: ribosome recycling factor, partial [Chloroflexota bacterium]